MNSKTICFIGGGNMARSLIGGLVQTGFDPARIRVTDPSSEKRTALQQQFGVEAVGDNRAAIEHSDVVVLAVKPQVVRQVLAELAEGLRAKAPLVVSIAAGVREADISRWIGGTPAVVRTMPNTPALVQSGATALYANDHTSEEQRQLAESILRAVGMTLWVSREAQLDAVTAVSGSGPAYGFLLMEMMEESGVELGLERETARLLAMETLLGAARLALSSQEEPAQLRAQVTSPGGTTERALQVLEQGQVRRLYQQALSAARDRAVELGEKLGAD